MRGVAIPARWLTFRAAGRSAGMRDVGRGTAAPLQGSLARTLTAGPAAQASHRRDEQQNGTVMEHIRGLTIARSLADAVAEPMALVVYDMQVGIVSQLSDGADVVARVAEVLDLGRQVGLRVFFTRHVSLPVEIAGVAQLRMAMDWQHRERADEVVAPFPPEAPQTQIVPELAPRGSEAVLDKITMSAFAGTYLDIALRDCGIPSFLIAGIALEVGIEPTVRQATDLGYLPVVVTDACGTGNAEAAKRSLEALAFAGGSLQADIASLRMVLSQRR
jgi:nicotinamidase-related amidase